MHSPSRSRASKVLHSHMSDGGNNFYASDFGRNILVFNRGRITKEVPSRNAEYRKHPSRWVQRREIYDLKAVYQKKEGEKGLLQVFLNGELCAAYPTNKYRKGSIGFR